MIFKTGLLKWTPHICILSVSSVMATSACSGFGICLILVENYLSVRHLSLQGGPHMSLRKAQISIVSFWVMIFTLQLVPIYIINQPQVQVSNNACKITGPSVIIIQMIMIILTLTTMFSLMIHIMLIVSKSLKNLFQGESSAADLHKQRSMKKKTKLATLFTIIAPGFILSSVPLIVSVAVTIKCPHCVPLGTADVMSSFVQLNSCVNFMVYVIKDKSFKNVCMQLLKCKPNEVTPLCSTATGIQ